MRRFTLMSMLLLVGVLSAAQGPDKAVQEDLKKLEGTWTYLSLDLAGKKYPEDIIGTGVLTIKGNTYRTELGGQVTDEGTFTIDPTKKPKTWDKVSTKFKDAKFAGVYEVDGDTLKYCEGLAGAERPAGITSKKGTLESAAVLKRKK
jgi:uncharacterized protein (TIGR03067 family)